jgi:hypothetical protein
MAFAKMGMDIIGLMPVAQGNLRYAEVALEYFFMWIEAKALATITSATIQKFFWQNIICRFGVPKSITVDNGTQLDSKTFREFCNQEGRITHFASVRHPESNRLVERENKIILLGITSLWLDYPKGNGSRSLSKLCGITTHLYQDPLILRHSSFSSGMKQLPPKKSDWVQQES